MKRRESRKKKKDNEYLKSAWKKQGLKNREESLRRNIDGSKKRKRRILRMFSHLMKIILLLQRKNSSKENEGTRLRKWIHRRLPRELLLIFELIASTRKNELPLKFLFKYWTICNQDWTTRYGR